MKPEIKLTQKQKELFMEVINEWLASLDNLNKEEYYATEYELAEDVFDQFESFINIEKEIDNDIKTELDYLIQRMARESNTNPKIVKEKIRKILTTKKEK